MSTTLRKSKLIDLCTPSISYDAQVRAACAAFDRQMYEVIDDTNGEVSIGIGDQPQPAPPQGIIFIPSIMDLQDETLVDILAWQFHVDFYDATAPLEFRKNLVQQSIIWHRRKGTVALVQEVLDTYWPGGATIMEWFDYSDPFPPPQPPTNWSGPLPPPSWHDRYRFRVYIDENIINPADEAKVLQLIDAYKPVSRWCEGIYRPTISDCAIGWYGMLLRFVYHESEAPDLEEYVVDFYGLFGPTGGSAGAESEVFTVALPAGNLASAILVTITPNDGGKGGTFQPASVTVDDDAARSATFKYTAAAGGGTAQIATTNDGNLIDPPPITYVSVVPPEIPETIPNLAAWWKASKLTLANATPVTSWTDASGTGRHATGSGAQCPTFVTNPALRILEEARRQPEVQPAELEALEAQLAAQPKAGGKPAIYFAAGNVLRFTPPLPYGAGYTVIAVGRRQMYYGTCLLGANSGMPAPEIDASGADLMYLSDQGNRWQVGPLGAGGAWRVWTIQSDMGAAFYFKAWQDAILLGLTHAGGWPVWAAGYDQIGLRGDGGQDAGGTYYHEILFYSRVLSQAELDQLHAYTTAEYGVPP